MKWTQFYNKFKDKKIFRYDELKMFDISSVTLNRWSKKGYLTKVMKGVYIIKEFEDEINEMVVSSTLYQPSYISLEYALNYHSFIPDVSFVVTNITPKNTRKFKTSKGKYIYRHVKKSLFFGYETVDSNGIDVFIAEPEKSLLDFFYFESIKGRIKNKEDFDRYRFNESELKNKTNQRKLKKYSKKFNDKTQDIVKLFIKGVLKNA